MRLQAIGSMAKELRLAVRFPSTIHCRQKQLAILRVCRSSFKATAVWLRRQHDRAHADCRRQIAIVQGRAAFTSGSLRTSKFIRNSVLSTASASPPRGSKHTRCSIPQCSLRRQCTNSASPIFTSCSQTGEQGQLAPSRASRARLKRAATLRRR